MARADRSLQRRDNETEIAETVATTLEPSVQSPISEDREGLTIHSWTMNKSKDWAAYQALPFDGILTDTPQAFRDWLVAAE